MAHLLPGPRHLHGFGKATHVGSKPRRAWATSCQAAAQGSAVKLADQPLLLLPPEESGALCRPGVYSVYNDALALQYVGVSRDVGSSLTAHAASMGQQEARHARALLMPGAAKPQLQAAWKAAIQEHGAIPPGNQPGAQGWATAAPQRPKVTVAAAPEALRSKVQACTNAASLSAVSGQVLADLCSQGYAVVDGVLPDKLMAEARQGAQMLRTAGLMSQVMKQTSQGRLDEIMVMDTAPGLQPGRPLGLRTSEEQTVANRHLFNDPKCQALASVAAFLKGLPEALMLRQAQAGSVDSNSWRLPELAVSENLQLAVYSGGGYYVAHVDNDTPEGDPTAGKGGPAWQGPPGQRVRDRAVTAIVYLNEDWDQATDGGCLRIHHPSPTRTDVSPLAGRLVLFQSRAVLHEVLPSARERWALSAWIPSLASFAE